MDKTLAAKHEHMKTMQFTVLVLNQIMKDDGVQAEKYKTLGAELAQTKTALVVSDNRANALCLELQNMKQLQNKVDAYDNMLNGELHEFIETQQKMRNKKLFESDVGGSADAVATGDVGAGVPHRTSSLGMYNEGQE